MSRKGRGRTKQRRSITHVFSCGNVDPMTVNVGAAIILAIFAAISVSVTAMVWKRLYPERGVDRCLVWHMLLNVTGLSLGLLGLIPLLAIAGIRAHLVGAVLIGVGVALLAAGWVFLHGYYLKNLFVHWRSRR